MSVTEAARHHLIERATVALGADAAMTLADLVPPVGWADVVTKRDLDHGLATHAQKLTELQLTVNGQIHELDQRLTNQIHELDQRLTNQVHELDQRLTGEIGALRADLHRLLGEQTRLVAEQTRVLVFTSLGAMVGFGSLVLGAVALAG